MSRNAFSPDILPVPPATPTRDVAADAVFRDSAFEDNKRSAVHRWVPWIAGFSAGFVADTFRHYLPDPDRRGALVLEPFSGVGTTLVEGLLHGYDVAGFEVNPFAALASRVKTQAFRLDAEAVRLGLLAFEHKTRQRTEAVDCAFLAGTNINQCLPAPRTAPPPAFRSRVPFFSPAVERKALHSLDVIQELPGADIRDLFLLAFGAVMVQFSNYSYEPSLGSRVAAGKAEIPNADVVGIITAKMKTILDDLAGYGDAMRRHRPPPTARLFSESSLALPGRLPPASADIVVTSPPYLNNYHYIRNTRPQLFWLNFIAAPSELKRIENENFGKYWQTVRDAPLASLNFRLPDLEERIAAIAAMHPEKGVYGGKGWANYAVEYFNDCERICRGLEYVLKPGGRAVFVLGNSITQGVEPPTDRIFGAIGELRGLELENIHLLRTKRVGNSILNSSVRNGETTRAILYETAVVLKKPMSHRPAGPRHHCLPGRLNMAVGVKRDDRFLASVPQD